MTVPSDIRRTRLAGFEDVPHYAFFAPAGTPQPAIDQFSAALSKVIAQPDVRDRLTRWGLAVQFMPQAQLASRERVFADVGANH